MIQLPELRGYSPILLKNFLIPFENNIRMKFMVMRGENREFEEYVIDETHRIDEILNLSVYRVQLEIDTDTDTDIDDDTIDVIMDPCLIVWVSDTVRTIAMPKFGG